VLPVEPLGIILNYPEKGKFLIRYNRRSTKKKTEEKTKLNRREE
jgi:hypothetical protein